MRFPAIFIVLLILTACHSSTENLVPVAFQLRQFHAGPGLQATVTIVNALGFRQQLQSDAEGKVRLEVPEGLLDITITGEAIGTSHYAGLSADALDGAELVASPVFNPAWTGEAPALTLELREADSSWEYRMQATSSLGIRHLFLALGRTPTSRIINPGVRFDYQEDSGWQSLDDLHGYSGDVTIYAVAYDLNRNRSEVRRVLELPEDVGMGEAPQPTLLSALTITATPALEILAHDEPSTALALVQWELLDWASLDITQGSYGYYVYKRKDDAWQRIARLAPFEDKWIQGIQLSESVQYAVSSFIGEQESRLVETAQLTPLAPFYSSISTPADGASGVSRSPTVVFDYPEQTENTRILHRFRIHDDVLGVTSAPSQNIINQSSYQWNEDGRFEADFAILKPFHPYRLELTLAFIYQLDELDNPKAFSVAVDSFGTIIAETFVTGSVNVFETGAE